MMAAIPETMNALVLTGPGAFEIKQVATPTPGPREALVRVGAIAICGSDPAIVEGVKFKGLWPPGYPFTPGHEWAGTVVALGDGAARFHPGDRVAAEAHKGCGYCRNCMTGRYQLCENYGNAATGHRHYGFTSQGGYAEYVVASEHAIHNVGDMPFDEATNVDTAATALHAVQRGRVAVGEEVCVFGPGAVGLLCLQLALASGVARCFVVGRRHRLKMAVELGAVAVDYEQLGDPVAEIRRLTGGRGVDVAIDCAGKPATVQQSLAAVCNGGRVVCAGFAGDVELSLTDIVMREIDVLGVRADPNTAEEVIRLINKGSIRIGPMISHRFPLSDFGAALETFSKNLDNAIKVVVEP
ncbi:MAG: alcohol dehydrogenase catalytic domain-containing protein [Rhodospirillales bacterium]|jgi:L-iditol 2-dehydrogenase|nr:alcohol dehydrogenase [Rhodospirillaceae bacterium]MDP6643575.1 alcohol dehydrogenase catalytic domain-containing protein [Rhodospirillales bacterium]MDP6840994.1 alcohol dehydrogenase catalytic domain-containing protein [Rhodospirillales bacterium]